MVASLEAFYRLCEDVVVLADPNHGFARFNPASSNRRIASDRLVPALAAHASIAATARATPKARMTH
jgi:hypothetical protein